MDKVNLDLTLGMKTSDFSAVNTQYVDRTKIFQRRKTRNHRRRLSHSKKKKKKRMPLPGYM